MLEAGDDADHEESRHENEVKPWKEYAAGSDGPENSPRLERPRETLPRRRLDHRDDRAARLRAESRERRVEPAGGYDH